MKVNNFAHHSSKNSVSSNLLVPHHTLIYIGHAWEEKSQVLLHADLVLDFIRLIIYVFFFIYVMSYFGLPLHLIRDLYLTLLSFCKRCNEVWKYHETAAKLDNQYPTLTSEQVEALHERICIICREELAVQWRGSSKPKKLPCGHVFHMRCLKNWIERQQVCPTCRYSLNQDGNNDSTRNGVAAVPQNGAPIDNPQAAAALQANARDNNNNNVRFDIQGINIRNLFQPNFWWPRQRRPLHQQQASFDSIRNYPGTAASFRSQAQFEATLAALERQVQQEDPLASIPLIESVLHDIHRQTTDLDTRTNRLRELLDQARHRAATNQTIVLQGESREEDVIDANVSDESYTTDQDHSQLDDLQQQQQHFSISASSEEESNHQNVSHED